MPAEGQHCPSRSLSRGTTSGTFEAGTGPLLTDCGVCGHHGQVRFTGLGQPCLKQRSKQLAFLKWLTQCRRPDPKKRGTLYTDVTNEPLGRGRYQRLVAQQGPVNDKVSAGVARLGFEDEQAEHISEDEAWFLRPLSWLSQSQHVPR